MRFTYGELLGPDPQDIEWEPVEGAFTCQTCHLNAYEAKYSGELNVLTWICPDKHISRIENFE